MKPLAPDRPMNASVRFSAPLLFKPIYVAFVQVTDYLRVARDREIGNEVIANLSGDVFTPLPCIWIITLNVQDDCVHN